ncbi:MAG: glycosyltransferase family 39 protein [Anaerolineae bacterium]|nr:glycosyltransferase family 39 protein [Anaerolineae bacterium]
MPGKQGNLRALLMLFILALLVRVFTALPLRIPGYMDAYYYYVGATSLYRGLGFNDPFIWNYLDNPAGIPHPSHLYWMPLSSVLAYLSFLLCGESFRAAQVPSIILSALFPLIAYALGYQIAHTRRHAVCAALFAVFSGFYMPFWVTTDNFAPFAVFGSLCLLTAGLGLRDGRRGWFALAGALASLAHLTRADGLLLLIAVYIAIFAARWRFQPSTSHPSPSHSLPLASCLLLPASCYLLVMTPWFIRNLLTIGAPLSPAGAKTLWLTNYDDLYSFGKELSWHTYLAWGWGHILQAKLHAAWVNFQRLWAEDLMIFLLPFAAAGAWRLRHRWEFLPALIYAPLLYAAMTLVFTEPGWRGGWFHSSVAFLPFLYAVAMEGLDVLVGWIARLRRIWDVVQARQVFSAGLVVLAVFLSAFLYGQQVLSGQPGVPPWNERDQIYPQLITWLDEHVPPETLVLVNSPPTFYYFSERPCLTVPNGDVETLLAVARRYGGSILILDHNRPDPLAALYTGELSDPGVELLFVLNDDYIGPVKVYRITL